jgi:hypothetical protein
VVFFLRMAWGGFPPPPRRIGGVPVDRTGREGWRMPPLAMLSAPLLSTGRKMGLTALRAYLAIAMILVIVKIIEVALAH